MSKRPASQQLIPGTAKKANLAQNPIGAPVPSTNILEPLLKQHLIRFSNDYNEKGIPPGIKNIAPGGTNKLGKSLGPYAKDAAEYLIKAAKDERYKAFAEPNKVNGNTSFENQLRNESNGNNKLDLAKFIINNLSRQDITDKAGKPAGKIDYIQLLKNPYQPIPGQRMDFYSGELGPDPDNPTQGIVMSPYAAPVNPITTLMHEGTHAFDDLLMRTYQKEAIDNLARQEAAGNFNLKDVYENARNILGHTDFKKEYPFHDPSQPNDDVSSRIQNSFSTLGSDIDDLNIYNKTNNIPTQFNNNIGNFREAQTAINDLNNADLSPDSSVFLPFSEFPSFAMERLFKKWDINQNTDPNAKSFLQDIMTGVRSNFKGPLGLQNPAYKDYKYGTQANPATVPNPVNPAKRQVTQQYATDYHDYTQGNPAALNAKRSNYPAVYQAFKDRKAQFTNPVGAAIPPGGGIQGQNNPVGAPLAPMAQVPPQTQNPTTTTTTPLNYNTLPGNNPYTRPAQPPQGGYQNPGAAQYNYPSQNPQPGQQNPNLPPPGY